MGPCLGALQLPRSAHRSMSFFFLLLFLSSAPLAHILLYDKLDDPTGVT